MIAVITADGSVVFSLPELSVHIDAQRRMVHVQDPHRPGAPARSFPADQAQLVTLEREGRQVQFHLDCEGGERLELGLLPVGEIARQIRLAVRRIAGRREGSAERPALYYEAETRRVLYPPAPPRLEAPELVETADELELDIEVNLDPDPTVPVALSPRFDSTP